MLEAMWSYGHVFIVLEKHASRYVLSFLIGGRNAGRKGVFSSQVQMRYIFAVLGYWLILDRAV